MLSSATFGASTTLELVCAPSGMPMYANNPKLVALKVGALSAS
jgi:hypothetical protein